MSDVKIVLRKSEIRSSLLTSKEAQEICMEFATNAAAALGEGYKAEARNYPERHGASVYAETIEAKRENAKNNTILKAVRA